MLEMSCLIRAAADWPAADATLYFIDYAIAVAASAIAPVAAGPGRLPMR